MKTFEYIIKDEQGMHVRPAGIFAKEAKKYESKITIEANGKTTDATKLMAIMAMGIKNGQTVKITVDGADEDTAFEAMKSFMEENL